MSPAAAITGSPLRTGQASERARVDGDATLRSRLPFVRITKIPRRAPRPIANAIQRPSGDQTGEIAGAGSRRTRRTWLPLPSLMKTCRSRVNASRRPSGDQAGSRSSAAPRVSRRADPPPAGDRPQVAVAGVGAPDVGDPVAHRPGRRGLVVARRRQAAG